MSDFFNIYKEDSILLFEVIADYLNEHENKYYEYVNIKKFLKNKNGLLYPQFKRNGDILNYRLSIKRNGTYVISYSDSTIFLYYEDDNLEQRTLLITRLDASKMEALMRNQKIKMLNLD